MGNTASSDLLSERQNPGRLAAQVLLLVAGLKMKLTTLGKCTGGLVAAAPTLPLHWISFY